MKRFEKYFCFSAKELRRANFANFEKYYLLLFTVMRFAKISEFSISKFLLIHEFPAPRNAFDSIFKFSNCRVKNLKTFNRHLEPPSRKFFFHEKFPLYSLYFPPPTATIHNLTVSHRRPANSYHLSGPLNRSYQQRSTTKFVVKRRNESGRKANTPLSPLFSHAFLTIFVQLVQLGVRGGGGSATR